MFLFVSYGYAFEYCYAAPFIEHLRNLKTFITNLQTKQIKLYFHVWFLFVTQGVKFKHFDKHVDK